MSNIQIISDLPFLNAPSAVTCSNNKTGFLAPTPMVVVNDKLSNANRKNLLWFQLVHEKIHIDQMRRIPFLGAMIWSILTAAADPHGDNMSIKVLEKARKIVSRVEALIEGQNLLCMLTLYQWPPKIRSEFLEMALVKGSHYYEGLCTLLGCSDILPAKFDTYLKEFRKEVQQTGLTFEGYVIGFVNLFMDVAPFLANKNYDPNIMFDGLRWYQCAKQSCDIVSELFQKHPRKKLIADISAFSKNSILKTAIIKRQEAYLKNFRSSDLKFHPFVLYIMQQLQPYTESNMAIPTFFVKDAAVRISSIPGKQLQHCNIHDYTSSWFFYAAAVKVLQARLGGVLRCPVYEIMEGCRANCCEQEPCEAFCSSPSVEHVLLEDREKICGTFWSFVWMVCKTYHWIDLASRGLWEQLHREGHKAVPKLRFGIDNWQ